jgi:penicillin V acylase-like amidase (Ntn superfamily)
MIRQKKISFFIFLLMVIFIIACTIRSSSACTIFTVSGGDKVLFGNNEDWTNPNTYIWFELSEEEKFGGVYLGFDNFFPQGGMNEKGLCFDANALPVMSLNYHPELPYSQGWTVKHIIDVCDNISQVIQVAQEFNWGTSMAYQVHFADASGDAVVISPGTDSELNFTRKISGEGFIVSTNFNVGYPENGWTPCWRYTTATEMLDNIAHEDNLTVEAIRDVLDAAHQEGKYATRYSNIFDLINHDVYIYQNFNFKKVVKLNLDEELAQENESYIPISDLFSRTTIQESQTEKTQEAPIIFLFISLVAIIIFRRKIVNFD